jgi:hypothetical protein
MPLTLVKTPEVRTTSSLAAHVKAIAGELRKVASDHLELAVLEAHQAGVRLANCSAVPSSPRSSSPAVGWRSSRAG